MPCATADGLLRNKSPQPPLKPEKPSSPLCATVGFGLESANVVGYQNLDSNASGFTMMAPTFLNVSFSEKCTLADLSVTGYSAPVKNETTGRWSGGTKGQFNLQFLTTQGKTEVTYRWYDDGTKLGWYDSKGTTKIDAETVDVVAGKAVWCQANGLKLVTAGAVNTADIAFQSQASGFTAMGNPFPVDLTLADLSVSGYSAPVKNETTGRWSGGTKGQFNLQFLTNQGKTEVTYRWYDDGTKLGWYDSKGTTKIDGSTVSIPAGKGLWCQGNGLVLNIPAPEL